MLGRVYCLVCYIGRRDTFHLSLAAFWHLPVVG